VNASLLALALLVTAGGPPRVLDLDPAASTVRFHVSHKLHQVDGLSRAAEVTHRRVRAMVRIPLQSFDSGDANRDAHMLETLQAGRFPNVVFKGVGTVADPSPGGRPAEVTLRGELDFHGVKRAVEVPVTVEFAADGSARVRGTMTVSLEAHQVERPSMLMMTLDDQCTITLDLKLGSAR
jgi:polyisoprenoid-binding protein YceI